MTALTSIIPGKVDNRGINDVSIPEYTPAQTTRPLHAPVIHGVFPKGQLADVNGIVWVNTNQFSAVFGDIFDPASPYYNPNSILIQALVAGGQASIGVRRLSANKKVARTALSAFVKKVTVQDYERDLSGKFVRDTNGDLVPIDGKTFEGVEIEVKTDPEAATKGVGELTRRKIAGTPPVGQDPGTPDIEVFPLFDGIGGVGDVYNRGGMNFGVNPSSYQFGEISDFVKATGVYPFNMREFTDTDKGRRTYAKTSRGREMVEATLFDALYQGTRFNLKRAFGEFTGTNVNRKVVPAPAPYSGVHVYQESITSLCQALFAIESAAAENNLLEIAQQPFRQMNPFTCVDHNGAPYYAITTPDTVSWDMTMAVKITGGISPFYDDEGKLPDYVTPSPVDDPFNVLTGVTFPISRDEAWQVNNSLIASDLENYVSSIEQSNYTRNRQSVFWDIGYSQDVKDQAVRLLGSRKDIMVIADATVWRPGKANNLNQIYARSAQLNSQVRMFPESEFWGTPTCRSSINLIEAYVIDEPLAEVYSANIDLAYAYALFAGNAAGIIVPSASPSHADNRILRRMHTPNIEFEGDVQSAENFNRGCITLRPYDSGDRLFRAALVTVTENPDSVLKDQVTAFLCICIEKICQDEWNRVCGDTNLSAANYVSVFKDSAERKCRDALGALARSIRVEPSYSEGTVGSKAIMNTRVHAYFNKGKYQMTLDLFAHNEEELANT